MKNNQAKLKAFLHYNSSVTFDSLLSAHLCIFCFYFMEKKIRLLDLLLLSWCVQGAIPWFLRITCLLLLG